MAKINHNNSLDTIDELITDAKKEGVTHLVSDLTDKVGRKLNISKKEFLNFGTCGYLGLELDQRLKEGAIDFTNKFGTQWGISRGFLSSGINEQLEDYLSEMFDNRPVITYSSTSSAHISVIPTIVRHEDAIILDQQVHMSVQTASQLLRQKGVPIEMIRHSNMEMLERLLEQLCRKHKKVWYMIDGVYSMYGDVAPMDKLIHLLDKYEQFHVYVDDAHGMSWYGKNGSGYINSKINNHPKIMLLTTMGKGFGVTGGIAVFPDKETYRKVRIFGGPLVYSHPLAPPIIGAAIASAKIHLSEDIYRIQKELQENIDYFNQLLSQTELIVISNPHTPINFIAMGQPKATFNMVNRLLDDGFFVNAALFPAVSMKNSGVRISLSRQVKKNEVKELIDALVYHYPKVLDEENKTIHDVRKAFRITTDQYSIKESLPIMTDVNGLCSVEEYRSIKQINKTEWDELLGRNGSFNWDGLLSLEDVFHDNPRQEENWNFYYFIIRDSDKQPILATFFTSTVCKDDMFALESVSKQIEEKRKTDPYYLTSKTLTMGSMLTEGLHYYINKNNPHWKKAFVTLIENITKIQESINANTVVFRDFDKDDIDLKEIFLKEGYAPFDMPNSNIIENMEWRTQEEFQETLSKWSKKNIRKDVFKYENKYEVEYKKELTEQETEWYYNLFVNVTNNNRGLNMFNYPPDILKKLCKHENWKFLALKLKPEFDARQERKAVAAVWCYETKTHFSPMIIGLDYNYNEEFNVYKQAMYQIVKQARMLNLSKVYFGLSSDFEKRKLGANQYPRVAYMQTKDNYNMEVIESMAAIKI